MVRNALERRNVVLAVLCTAALVAIGPARADDLSVASRIVAVTVYPSGAEVTRTASATLPAGATTLTFADLPDDIVANTLRVDAASDGALQLGAVETRDMALTREEIEAQAAARRDLETRIEETERAIAKLGYEVQVKETQRDYLVNLASLPTQGRPGGRPANGDGPVESWASLFDLIGTSMTSVQAALFDLNQQQTAAEKKLADLRTELDRLAPAPTSRTVGAVSVSASTPAEATITLRYQVREASWQPLYDARLDTGTKDRKPALALVRRAAISQTTSEPWTDVALTLSTVRPSGRTAAPDPRPMIVDFKPQPMLQRGVVGTMRMESAPAMAPPVADAAPAPMAKMRVARPARPATEIGAVVSEGSFQASYAITDATTVVNTGAVKRVRIDDATLAPELLVRTVPREDPRAYLYARIDLPSGTPFLAGQIALFRDGTFVGMGRLPELAGGAKHELGFGSDDLVTVKFAVADESRGQTGIISSSRTDRRGYRITVENKHQQGVSYTVLDRVPVPVDEDIKVVRNGGSVPTRQNVDDKRGVVAWDGKLAAQEKREIEFGYEVAWPDGREVVYR